MSSNNLDQQQWEGLLTFYLNLPFNELAVCDAKWLRERYGPVIPAGVVGELESLQASQLEVKEVHISDAQIQTRHQEKDGTIQEPYSEHTEKTGTS